MNANNSTIGEISNDQLQTLKHEKLSNGILEKRWIVKFLSLSLWEARWPFKGLDLGLELSWVPHPGFKLKIKTVTKKISFVRCICIEYLVIASHILNSISFTTPRWVILCIFLTNVLYILGSNCNTIRGDKNRTFREIFALYTPYSKMAAILIFFYLPAN